MMEQELVYIKHNRRKRKERIMEWISVKEEFKAERNTENE